MIRLFLSALLALAPAGIAQAQTSAAPAATQAYPKGRLADVIQPKSYRLDLTVDPAQARFSGKVEIDVVLREPTSVLYLHGRNLRMKAATAKVTRSGASMPGSWRQLDDSGVAALSFTQPLPPGEATLAFEYDAAFGDSPAGLFRVKVGEDWYSWSQFQSIDARAAFPSFDQPSFKTPFTVTLRTPAGLTAVSNAPEIGTHNEGGLDVHRFAPTLPLPTYLVAVMVGPFAKVESAVAPSAQRSRPLPLRVISTRQNAAKLDFALQGSKEIVGLLEDYFADGFPYPKLDQITSPIMPGAMENAGADLYGDPILVMAPTAPTSQKRVFGMVVAHELAHQWFGDLVTPAWWDDIWLNESFANWMGYRIGHAWRPDLNIGAGALAEGFAAMDTDALSAGRAIRQTIATNDQIDAAFDTITYGKGGHVIAMIAAFMGDAAFRDGVRRYMAAHRYGNATSTDFFAAMANAAHDPRIVPAMQSFIDQQGVPLLTFSRSSAGWTVTQQPFAPLGAEPAPRRWGVPLCLRRGETRQCTLLEGDRATLSLAGDGPLVPNAGGTGYYRFDLAPEDWDALIQQAETLSGGEAQAAVDSLRASVLAGRGDTARLAALAEKLAGHADSYASEAGIDALNEVGGQTQLTGDARKSWRRFVTRLYAPLLAQYGFDPRAGAYAAEDPERAQRRVQVVSRLSGTARDKALRGTIEAAARAFLGGDASALDPTWYGLAFETYVAKGKKRAARQLVDAALASEDPVLRPVALASVAGSGSTGIADWLLELDDPRLRASEKRDLLRGIILTSGTRELGYAWLRAHLGELTSGTGGIFFAARLPQLLSRFCSVERAEEFARDLRPHFAGKPGALELERAIERVRRCGAMRAAQGNAISTAFARLK